MSLLKKLFARKAAFQFFWHGGCLPPLAWLSLSSFVNRRHRVHLYAYEALIAPREVQQEPANRVVDPKRLFYINDSYAQFSDLFRCELLLKRGGWWIDTDVLCMTESISENDIVFAEEENGFINGAIVKFPKNHPAMKTLRLEIDKIKIEECGWDDMGPNLLTRVLKTVQLDGHALPRTYFYPLDYAEAYKFILPEFYDEITDRIKSSACVHFWNYMYHLFGFDIVKSRPPSGSFLDVQFSSLDIYQHYESQEIDERKLRNRINEYIGQPSVCNRAKELGFQVSPLRI